MSDQPTAADIAWYDRESGYVGFSKPTVRISVEVPDKYAWKRQEAANRLGVDESELADEPDFTRLDNGF